ncbi:hypothetical protein FRC14_000355 [Serendipita sp. 396]|nr:hypothetical protein FRC14_000355 [Serendipita sp. 396]KAG8870373.1 hypothetical protein FRC20_011945 [Serendipita sp. 405]
MSSQTVAELALAHIMDQYASWKVSPIRTSPLFVAIQGPQGIGKTYLTRQLVSALDAHQIRTVSFSIDDLYFGYEEMNAIETANSGNALLRGRGLPGTHDIPLGARIMKDISMASDEILSTGQGTEPLCIPVYDKAMHNGLGDRLPVSQWTSVSGPVDVVIVEGWCMGFYPITESELAARWERKERLGFPASLQLQNGMNDIQTINNNLESYVNQWYPFFHCLIQIAPSQNNYNVIYKWRLQQEHTMKAANGGKGMSDNQVTTFIDRYLPCYIFFGDGVKLGYISDDDPAGRPPWATRSLQINVDDDRVPVSTERF